MDQKLQDFIAHARKKGMDHQTIRMLLLSAGWKEKDIAQAVTEESLDMAVPVPSDGGGARDAFFHLLTFVAFFTTTISLIILFFDYINRLFPDAALQTYYTYDDVSGIRWSLAAVIVAFPIFMLLSRFLLKEMKVHPEKSASGVRRWLTYLTLFVAAAALMGDVITLVFYLLEGELSIRFILKVLVVLIIAGLTFTYYFLSLKLPPAQEKTVGMHRSFGLAAVAIVLVALVWGIVLAGSPLNERQRKFDERRVEDLRIINSEIRTVTLDYRASDGPALKRALPQTLDELRDLAQNQMPNVADPQNGAPYEYSITGDSTFRLCATFNFPRDEQYDVSWNHPAGNYCYDFDVLESDNVLQKPKPRLPSA